MAETKYNVIGGEYADTTFSNLAPGATAERHGPMTKEEAMVLWRSLSSKSVDNCMVRYYVRAVEEAAAEQWFVAGGEYSDTSFKKIAAGRELQSFGPFTQRADALVQWRAVTGRTVDDALCRFDIVTKQRLDEMKRA